MGAEMCTEMQGYQRIYHNNDIFGSALIARTIIKWIAENSAQTFLAG